MLTDAFRGHGAFVYLAEETLAKYHNDPDALVASLRQAGMSHVWVRLHDYQLTPEPEVPTRRLVQALVGAKIAVAGWGFDSGHDPEADAATVAGYVKKYGLSHYVADIEQDEHESSWTPEKIPAFLRALKKDLPAGAQVLVSSYPYLKAKHPELMRAAASVADGFAPQIYWQLYPSENMLKKSNLPSHPSRPYDVHADSREPASYAHLCLDWWREFVGQKPLLLTGQAYWEGYPAGPVSREIAETKLERFLEKFDGWSRVVGVNWWHLGHARTTDADGAMTKAMYDSIVAAQVHAKPFASG